MTHVSLCYRPVQYHPEWMVNEEAIKRCLLRIADQPGARRFDRDVDSMMEETQAETLRLQQGGTNSAS